MSKTVNQLINLCKNEPEKVRSFIAEHGGEIKPHEWSAITMSLLANATADDLTNLSNGLQNIYGNY